MAVMVGITLAILILLFVIMVIGKSGSESGSTLDKIFAIFWIK